MKTRRLVLTLLPGLLLAFLFLGGAVPAEPGPLVCGTDPTEDPLHCAPFSSCR